ncbi:protein cereblon-like [Corticium candelabrum]|uniref:protein cereblon-like n=1 Tax=Corticium candelabrum TaxID=121492 RepID=UPI002E25361C|nr:protein cereblon-like [Corticium candelabrum]
MADQEERNALLDNEEEEESDDEMFQLVVHEEIADSDEEDGEDDETGDGRERGNDGEKFDRALPATHSYLGDGMDELSGRTVLDSEKEIELPLLPMYGVVLMPGETLPLHLFMPQFVTMMKRCLEGNKTFGVCTIKSGSDTDEFSDVGTTAEIFSVKEDTSGGIHTMTVKATGRQRFKIISKRRQSDRVIIATVSVLADEPLVARPAVAFACPRELMLAPCEQVVNTGERGKDGCVTVSKGKAKMLQQLRRDPPCLSPLPSWVYRMFDPFILTHRVANELLAWSQNMVIKHQSDNPTEFSYWVAANLPLDDTLRLELLMTNSVIYRLQKELDVISKYSSFCCRHCDAPIGHKDDVFSMSVDGALASYVNPGGYVHQTLTLYKVTNLSIISRPVTQDSWFPGYAWSIAQCSRCHSHMGWRFTSSRHGLRPSKFYGITRSSIKPAIVQPQNGDEEGGKSRMCRQS